MEFFLIKIWKSKNNKIVNSKWSRDKIDLWESLTGDEIKKVENVHKTLLKENMREKLREREKKWNVWKREGRIFHIFPERFCLCFSVWFENWSKEDIAPGWKYIFFLSLSLFTLFLIRRFWYYIHLKNLQVEMKLKIRKLLFFHAFLNICEVLLGESKYHEFFSKFKCVYILHKYIWNKTRKVKSKIECWIA